MTDPWTIECDMPFRRTGRGAPRDLAACAAAVAGTVRPGRVPRVARLAGEGAVIPAATDGLVVGDCQVAGDQGIRSPSRTEPIGSGDRAAVAPAQNEVADTGRVVPAANGLIVIEGAVRDRCGPAGLAIQAPAGAVTDVT